MTRVAALAAALAACSSRKEPPPKPDACETQLARLATWSARLAAEGTRNFFVDDDFHLATLDIPPTEQPPLPVASLTTDQLIVNGQLTSAADLESWLRVHAPPEIAVLVDEQVAWRRISELGGAAARGGVKRLRFIVHGTSTLAKPPPSWIDRELDEAARPFDPNGPAPDLERAMQRANDPNRRRLFANCPAGRDMFAHLDEHVAKTKRSRSDVLLADLPGALRACGCAEDINAVERWLWSMWGRDEPQTPQAALVIALDGTPPRTDLTADTPWFLAAPELVKKPSL